MRLTSHTAAFRRALRPMKGPSTGTGSCEIRTAATNWSSSIGNQFVGCHYEETQPNTGGRLDMESGNGYGYTVWFDAVVTLHEGDTVLVNGIEIQVQGIPPRGNLTPGTRINGAVR